MKEKPTPAKKPATSTSSIPIDSEERAARSMQEQTRFLGAVMNMSWQLAVVVLVPVLGGHILDSHFKSSPIWTIAGFVVAVAAASVVVWRQATAVSPHDLERKNKETRR